MRKTKASQAVLHVLQESGKALTHKDLQVQLSEVCDRVTIYRVLARLNEEGLIHRVSDPEGVMRYAACETCDSDHAHSHDHLHFTCTTCGDTTCLLHADVHFTLPHGFSIQETQFNVVGVCPECRPKP